MEELKKENDKLKAVIDRLYISSRMDYDKIEKLKDEIEHLKKENDSLTDYVVMIKNASTSNRI
jgi:FtsZ-binding cell division protein ZapB